MPFARVLILGLFSVTTSVVGAADLDFAHDVLPILRTRCGGCHAGGADKGGLSLETRTSLLEFGAIEPGDADASAVIDRVTSDDPELRMPPTGSPLGDEEVAMLRRWIDAGAEWPAEIRLGGSDRAMPISLPELAEFDFSDSEHPIDSLVERYWQRHDLPTPSPATDAVRLRRVYLDLVGVLPTPDEQQIFAEDDGADRWQRLVDDLLSRDAAVADHWLSFWNDLLRNDYTGTGYIDGGRTQITAWLYAALRDNVPYDQFVRGLVAPGPGSEGFAKGIRWRGNVNASQRTELQFAQNVGQVFLGINLKCASCHDSFIDRWKLSDAYSLASVVSEKPLEMYECDQPTGEFAEAGFLFPELGEIDAASPVERQSQLADLMTGPTAGLLARTVVNRLWQRMLGRGIVEPVDQIADPAWDPELLDYLATDLVAHDWDLRHTMRRIATSQAYHSQAAEPMNESESFVFRGPQVKRMTAEQWVDAVWQLTDRWPAAGEAPLGDGVDHPQPIRAARMNADRLMRVLGRPPREQVVSTRPDTLTTLQALELTNGESLAELLSGGAERLLEQQPDRAADQWIDWLWQSALCRSPTAQERRIAGEILGPKPDRQSLTDLLWSLVMLPEFHTIP